MKVKLLRTWFYPIDAKPANDKRAISGGRYKAGIHDMPNELRSYLPKGAVILDDPITDNFDETIDEATDIVRGSDDVMEDLGFVKEDLDRAAGAAEDDAVEKAEETRQALIKEKRIAALTKAREAKKVKKDAK